MLSLAEVVREVTRHEYFARDGGGKLYHYDRGAYSPNGEAFVTKRVKQVYLLKGSENEWSSYRTREVVKFILADAQFLWDKPPLDRINLVNGLLDLGSRQLSEHSPSFLWPIQIPVEYNPSETCGAWDWFIEQVFPEDSIHIAYEIAGILLYPDRSFQKAILLPGAGGNGKSTYLQGLTSFIGKENVTNLSLHDLEENRFAAARLYGKLANICPDLPSADLFGTSVFKALTGTDRITGEYKYKDSFEFEPFAKLLFSTNRPPRTNDTSNGFWDRWIVIPFEREFRGNEQEIPRNDLDNWLSRPDELSGLLNKALGALSNVQKRGGVDVTPSLARGQQEFRETSDPLAVWLDKFTQLDSAAFESKRRLIDAYNQDCDDKKRPQITNKAFGSAFKKLRPSLEEGQRTIEGKRQDVYLGIKFKKINFSSKL
jgi:P4 family phage/plasmid primase-like protien